MIIAIQRIHSFILLGISMIQRALSNTTRNKSNWPAFWRTEWNSTAERCFPAFEISGDFIRGLELRVTNSWNQNKNILSVGENSHHSSAPTLPICDYLQNKLTSSSNLAVITFTTRIESEVNPHSSATLSFNGEWQAASLKSVPWNKLFDPTAAMCFFNEHNFPPTCWEPRNQLM